MNTFLSWSGSKSHAVAATFSEWLPTVLNGVKPWISSKDIDKGATWISSIKQALHDSQGMGIFFVTRESHTSPWLLFEAGSIASLGHERVCVVYIDIEPSELQAPLSLFQGTKLEKNDIFALVKTLNKSQKEPVPEKVLDKSLERGWQDLETAIKHAIASSADKQQKKPRKPATDEILTDISSAVQRIESRLSSLETKSQTTSTVRRKLSLPAEYGAFGLPPEASHAGSLGEHFLTQALVDKYIGVSGTSWDTDEATTKLRRRLLLDQLADLQIDKDELNESANDSKPTGKP